MMNFTIQMTPRQSARVLEQALRTHARLHIEVRCVSSEEVLTGTLERREGQLLWIDVGDLSLERATGWIGAFCDVQTVLSGQLYCFTTCIIDIGETPRRLLLAVPQVVLVANRRRYERRELAMTLPLRLWTDTTARAVEGELLNLSSTGLACRMPRADLDDLLCVGDVVRTQFELPWFDETFDVQAAVCSFANGDTRERFVMGLEFIPDTDDPELRNSLERLRTRLGDLALQGHKTEGE